MIEEEMETIGIKDICAYVMSMAEIEDQSMRPKEIEDELESYLPKILEMDLDLLNKERDNLWEDMKTREKENETNFLMHSNHVIKASDKSIHVLHNYEDMKKKEEIVGSQISDLSSTVEEYKSTLSLEERNINTQLSQGIANVNEVMEIPGLLYTCIKLRSYPEAIDLISYFTQDIYPIYKDNPFINLIKEEVEKLSEQIRENILEVLKESIDMEETIINFELYRRIEDVKESNVVEILLELRDSFLVEEFTRGMAPYVSTLVENSQRHTQKDIFNCLKSYISSYKKLPQIITDLPKILSKLLPTEYPFDHLVSTYTTLKISELTIMLKNCLPSLTNYEHYSYLFMEIIGLADKLLEVGIKIHPVFRQIFVAQVRENIQNLLNMITDTYDLALADYLNTNSLHNKGFKVGTDLPEQLMPYPLILLFVANILYFISLIQKFIPKDIHPILMEKFKETLLYVVKTTSDSFTTKQNTYFITTETKIKYAQLFTTLVEIGIPYLIQKFSSGFGIEVPQEEKADLLMKAFDYMISFKTYLNQKEITL